MGIDREYTLAVFSDILAELSTQFLANCTPENIDNHIQESLSVCAQALQADKAALFMLSEDESEIGRQWVHSDCLEDDADFSIWECVTQQRRNVAWCSEQFHDHGYILIDGTPGAAPCDLPSRCCQSAIIVPIELHKETVGFLEVSSSERVNWNDTHADMCRIMSVILVLQIYRIDSERLLLQNNRELDSAVQLAAQSIRVNTAGMMSYAAITG